MPKKVSPLKKLGLILAALAWVFAAFFFSSILSAVIIRIFIPTSALIPLENSPLFLSGFYIASDLLLFSVTLLIPHFFFKEKWSDFKSALGFTRRPSWTDVGLAPIGYAVAHLIAIPLIFIFSFFPWFNAEEAQDLGFTALTTTPEIIFTFLAIVIIAPIVEETIFRGWLYQKLRRFLSIPIATILVSLAFGIVHLQWNVGVTVFAMSIPLCLLREYTGSTYSGILVHALNNGIAFSLLYLL